MDSLFGGQESDEIGEEDIWMEQLPAMEDERAWRKMAFSMHLAEDKLLLNKELQETAETMDKERQELLELQQQKNSSLKEKVEALRKTREALKEDDKVVVPLMGGTTKTSVTVVYDNLIAPKHFSGKATQNAESWLEK